MVYPAFLRSISGDEVYATWLIDAEDDTSAHDEAKARARAVNPFPESAWLIIKNPDETFKIFGPGQF